MVVGVLDCKGTDLRITRRHRDETVLAVVGVCIPSIVREIAVCIVGEIVRLVGLADCSIDRGVLVEVVGGVGLQGVERRRRSAVTGRIVGVSEVVGVAAAVVGRIIPCAGEFRAAVVEPLASGGE